MFYCNVIRVQRLAVPSNVRNFVRTMGWNCLPTRVKLIDKEVHVGTDCRLYGGVGLINLGKIRHRVVVIREQLAYRMADCATKCNIAEQRVQQARLHWQLPPPNYIKCNVDVVFWVSQGLESIFFKISLVCLLDLKLCGSTRIGLFYFAWILTIVTALMWSEKCIWT